MMSDANKQMNNSKQIVVKTLLILLDSRFKFRPVLFISSLLKFFNEFYVGAPTELTIFLKYTPNQLSICNNYSSVIRRENNHPML